MTSPHSGPDDADRRQHDLGGLELGPIDRHEHPRTLFEMRVYAMLMLLTHPNCAAFKVDALRRAVENYSKLDYEQLPYYQRWLKAIRQLLVEQGVLTDAQIESRLKLLRDRMPIGGQ